MTLAEEIVDFLDRELLHMNCLVDQMDENFIEIKCKDYSKIHDKILEIRALGFNIGPKRYFLASDKQSGYTRKLDEFMNQYENNSVFISISSVPENLIKSLNSINRYKL